MEVSEAHVSSSVKWELMIMLAYIMELFLEITVSEYLVFIMLSSLLLLLLFSSWIFNYYPRRGTDSVLSNGHGRIQNWKMKPDSWEDNNGLYVLTGKFVLAARALFVIFQTWKHNEYAGIIAVYPWLQKILSTPIVLFIPWETCHPHFYK